ncbi:hypothetical protein GVO57_09350 [Sphingomonas changnyeongensis]|uniref:Prohead serine protease domain-containing protein n=1 Tax=Sphingomonas changnyeongensis TaxID=2698679 RepID=A0A7Z2S8T5_9SPHN|nr:HK97 family phage prohead protease [Sphingomonas changnyeongensis]QHL90987.1 hypothetical protein GVO57_09350 [Sphingomonas changnyeongensis]
MHIIGMTRSNAEHRPGPPAPRGTRVAQLSSYSAEAHTIEAVFATDTPVARWFGQEELAISATAIDLTRVATGLCPFLNGHNQSDVGAVLGTVETASVRGGQLVGRVRFADTPAARQAEAMVAAGTLRGVSVGYQVRRWTLVESGDAGDTWRADDWALLEVSLVPVPADPNAIIRSGETDVNRSIDAAPAPSPHPAAIAPWVSQPSRPPASRRPPATPGCRSPISRTCSAGTRQPPTPRKG